MWHSQKNTLRSLTELKMGLMDFFPADVLSTTSFQIGYLEPPSNTKRWLVEEHELIAMYEFFEPRSKINLWCDAKVTEENNPQESDPPGKKRKSKRYSRGRN